MSRGIGRRCGLDPTLLCPGTSICPRCDPKKQKTATKKRGIVGPYTRYVLSFIRNFQSFLQSECTILHSYQQCIKLSIALFSLFFFFYHFFFFFFKFLPFSYSGFFLFSFFFAFLRVFQLLILTFLF